MRLRYVLMYPSMFNKYNSVFTWFLHSQENRRTGETVFRQPHQPPLAMLVPKLIHWGASLEVLKRLLIWSLKAKLSACVGKYLRNGQECNVLLVSVTVITFCVCVSTLVIKVSLSVSSWNWILAHGTEFQLMDLHASSWNCMQGYWTSCNVMELYASSFNKYKFKFIVINKYK